MTSAKARFWGFVLLIFPALGLAGAEITVPRLEMITRGAEDNGEFALSSNAAVDIALNGGYKFGIVLGLSFEAVNLGKAFAYRDFGLEAVPPGMSPGAGEYNQLADRYNNQAALSFRMARAIARDLFNQPFELSYFVGQSDAFCSGEEFFSRFGVSGITTDFTGFYYFPDGIGGNPYRRYNGLHTPRGTGLSFVLTRSRVFVPMLYLYQDFPVYDAAAGALSESLRYSGDMRFLVNEQRVKAEFFAGMSGGKENQFEVRGGLLGFFDSGKGTEFLLHLGIPGWKTGEEFSIDNLYLLFETRVYFGYVSLAGAFFYHPLVYMHITEPEEQGRADINLKVLFGRLPREKIQWGAEFTTGLNVNDMEDLYIRLSPFLSFLGTGLQWNFKLRLDPLAESPGKIAEIFAGVQTAY
jgi:hypothetical protein